MTKSFRTIIRGLAILLFAQSFYYAYAQQTRKESFFQYIEIENNLLSESSKSGFKEIGLPLPNGELVSFQLIENNAISKKFKAANPGLSTYDIISASGLSGKLTINTSVNLVYAIIETDQGTVSIEPQEITNPVTLISYYGPFNPTKNVDRFESESCMVNEKSAIQSKPSLNLGNSNKVGAISNGATRKDLDIVIVGTGEFWAENGSSTASTNTVISNTIQGLNNIFEKDCAIRMTLVGSNVYSNAATDPFTPDGSGGDSRLNQAIEVVDMNFASGTYDIGHVVHGYPTTGSAPWSGGGVGGLGVVCNNSSSRSTSTFGNPNEPDGLTGPNKSAGWSGSFFNTGNSWIQLFTHEVGHQFGAKHTFNGTGFNCTGNINSDSSYEIASGNTIMSYNGICGPTYNIADGGTDDNYFHIHSIDQILDYMALGSVACETDVATSNNPPSVNANPCMSGGLTIPINTPFVLTGSGADLDGDDLIYTWEQYDEDGAGTDTQGATLTQTGTTGLTAGNYADSPLFRWYPPTSSPTRYFPILESAANGGSTEFEVLPNIARTMEFVLTARDCNSSGGGIACASTIVTAASSGPLTITDPCVTNGSPLTAGNSYTINWAINGSGSLCTNADILLSVDGGCSFPYNLGSFTYSSQTASVCIPASVSNTTEARFMIRCGDNDCQTFFAISQTNCAINSTCTAFQTEISPDDPVSFNQNDPGLNLSLTNNLGTIITSVSGSITTSDPASNLAGINGGSCTVFSNQVRYDEYNISVDVTGSYTFTRTSGSFNLVQNLYNGDFISSGPCTNHIASSFNNGNTSTMTATLQASKVYKLVVTSFSSTSPTLPAAYTISFTSPVGANIYNGVPNPAGYAYTYLAVNIATDNVAAESSTSNFTTIAGGDYCVYGLHYPSATVTPSTWIGSSIQSNINGNTGACTGSDCALASSNCKPMTVIGSASCDDPTTVSCSNASLCGMDISWTAATTTPEGYSVQYSDDSGTTWNTIQTTGQQHPWINELHYDDDTPTAQGGDMDEGVEIAGPAGLDLSCYRLQPYNGNGGGTYGGLNLSGTIDNEVAGFGAVWFPISGLQNGAPDGVALVYNSNGTCNCPGPSGISTVIEFISYEGTISATNGPANGMNSVDIGVSESNSTPAGQALQLSGNSNSASGFTWGGPSNHSRGNINSGQAIYLVDDLVSSVTAINLEPCTNYDFRVSSVCSSTAGNWVNASSQCSTLSPDISLAVTSGSPVCENAPSTISVASSETDVSYAVFNSSMVMVGTAMQGNGGNLVFNIPGTELATAGTYTFTVEATKCSCTLVLSNTASIVVNSCGCPTLTTAPTALSIAMESSCMGPSCSVSGGSWSLASSPCPMGSSLQSFPSAVAITGGSALSSAPTYNQTTAETYHVRCVCDIDNTMLSPVQTVTSNPGSCTDPADPSGLSIVNSSCMSGTVSGGSFVGFGSACTTGTLTFYSDPAGTMGATTTQPSYNQTGPVQTLYTRCVDATTGCESNVITLGPTIPGTCPCTDPTNVACSNPSFQGMDVSWTAATNASEGYSVQYSDDSGTTWNTIQTSGQQHPWINELHYDNDGADMDEGIEVAGPAGLNLTCYRLDLYNGSNGTTYDGFDLSGNIDEEIGGFGAVWFARANIQNGGPDGVALVYESDGTCNCPGINGNQTVIEFLSYEGSFNATNGPANGMTSTDIGVSETGSTAVGDALQVSGSANAGNGFTWNAPAPHSQDMLNAGQDVYLVDNNTTTVSAINLEPCTSYDFRVISVCSGMVGAWVSSASACSTASPNVGLTVTSNTPICPGASSTITVAGTETGVSYAVYNSSSSIVGSAMAGTGGNLVFSIPNTELQNIQSYNFTVEATVCSCTQVLSTTAIIVVDDCCPTLNTAPNALSINSESSCMGPSCMVSGGSWTLASSPCPVDSELQSFPDATTTNGGTLLSTAPSYNQTTTETYHVRCVCLNDNSIVSPVQTISSNPGSCVNPSIGANGVDPTTCGGSDGSINISGLISGNTYTVNYTGSTGTPANGGMATASGGQISITGLIAGGYINISVDDVNACGSNVIANVSLSDPSSPTVNDPSDQVLCAGASTTTVNFSGTSGATFDWVNDTPSIGLGASGAGDILSFTAMNAGSSPVVATITVTPSLAGCTGTPETFTMTVNPLPSIGSSGTNPTSCGGSDGSIAITGLTSGNTYTVNYTGSAGTPANGGMAMATGGQIVITGLIAGNYTNISAVDANTCSSNVIANVSLSDPSSPTVNDPNDQVLCAGASTTTVNFSGTSGATFDWVNDTPSIGLGVSGTGDILSFTTMNGGSSPLVATITVTPSLAGCTGTPETFTITVNPLPSIGASGINPTTCGGTNGSIAITGLTSGNTYTVNYAGSAGTPANGGMAMATGGQIAITGLIAGNYTNISVVDANTCVSNVVANVSLSDPSSPTVNDPSDQVLCAGASTTTVNFSGTSGATFDWVNDTPSIGLGASGTGDILSFTAMNAGSSPVIATITLTPSLAGCTGTPETFTITVNPLPSIGASGTNPTSCGGTDGSIAITGLTSGNTYTVNYTGSAGTPANGGMAMATGGQIAITGLIAGNYTNISVVDANTCVSNVVANVSLSDPSSPTVNDPSDQVLCAGASTTTVNFSGTSGATFDWVNDTPSIGLGAIGTGDILSFTAMNAGSSPVVATITVTPSLAGCTGAPETFTITVNPLPSIGASGTNPTSCGGTDGSIAITGLTSGNTYTVNYTGSAGTPANGGMAMATGGQIAITGLIAGNYTNISIVDANTCSSNVVANVSLSDPSSPTVNDPNDQALCAGASTTTVNFSGTSGASFDWTNDSPSIGLGASGSGDILSFTAMNAGSNPVVATITVTPSLAGCTGTAETFTITVNPLPSIGASGTNPTTCGGSDGSVTITGLTSGNTYTVNYTGSAGTPANGGMAMAAGGQITISGLIAGNYTNISVVDANTCSSNVIANVSLTDPSSPTVNDPNDQALCAGASTTTVNFSGTSGASFDWTNDTPSIGLGASGSGDILSFTAMNAGSNPVVATITVTPSLAGCTGASETFTITVNPLPSIGASGTNPTTCGGSDGGVTITGLTSGNTYTVNYTGSAGTPANGGMAIAAGGQITISGLIAGNYTNISVVDANTCSSNVIANVSLSDPSSPTVNDPNDQALCAGASTTTVSFSGTSGAIFDWTNDSPSIGLGASGSGDILSFTAMNGGSSPVVATITVTPSLAGCTGIAETFTITVNPLPSIGASGTNPTTCGGSDGSVTITGLTSGNTYTVNYTGSAGTPVNGGMVMAAGGQITISGLIAGNYTNISVVDANTCSSNVVANVSLSDPSSPTVNDPNDQALCAGASTTTVNFSGTSGASFDWTNDSPSIGLGASGSGDILSFTAMNAGSSPVVATITVTPSLAGCTGAAETFTITVNPLPSIGASGTNPTTCGGSDGSVTITGLTSGNNYTVNYTGSPGTPANGGMTMAAGGQITISGLIAGNYTNISVVDANTCSSNVVANVSLSDPSSPTVNDPSDQDLCAGSSTTTVSFSGTSGASFDWTNDSPSIGLGASGSGDILSFTANNAGSSPVVATITVTPSLAGCTGMAETFTITVNPLPSIGASGTNPTTCGGSDGSVTITGLTSGNTYTVNYTGSAGTPANGGMAMATGGQIAITGLLAGSYTNISVVDANTCSSNVVANVSLSDPSSPTVNDPNDQILCAGSSTTTVNFSGTSGATFSWVNDTPSIGLAANGTGDISSFAAINTGNSPVVATITVTPSLAICTGSPETFTITVNPLPSIGASGTNPTSCGGSDGSITISGLTSGLIYTVFYTGGVGNPVNGGATTASNSQITITGLSAGPYINISVEDPNSCSSNVVPSVMLSDPSSPTVNDPSDQVLCAGSSTTTVNFSGTSGATFSWVNDTPSIGLAANGTGDISSFAAINAGNSPVVASIIVTPSLAGCTGTAETFTITVNPLPSIGASGTNPTSCGGSDGSITITGLTSGNNYTVNYTGSAGTPANGGMAMAAGGQIVITGLIAGNYTNISVVDLNTCSSNVVANVSLSDPSSPTVNDPNDQILCAGSSTTTVNFSGTSGATFSWVNDTPSIGLAANGTGDISSFAAINTGNSTVVATITVTPSLAGCSGTPETFTITVNPLPSIGALGTNPTTCGGSDGSIAITGLTSGNTYTVNYTGSVGTPANGATAMATGGQIVITGLVSGPYTNISVEDPNSCSSNLVPSVMLSDPTSPTVNDPSDQVLCKGASTTTVNFSGTSGASFSWTNDTPSIGLAASGSGDISSFAAVNAGSNPVVATIAVTPSLSGCTGTAETFTITVNPLSTIGASGTNPTSCGGSEGSIAITGLTSGNTYTVNYTGSAGTPANGGTAMASGGQIVITGLIAGNYTNISVVDANTCSSNVVANVSLNDPSNPTVNDPSDQDLCAGASTTTVNFSGSPGASFSWINDTPSIGLAASGSGDISSFTAVNAGSNPVVATITVTPSLSGCTGTAETFTITVNPLPLIAASGTNPTSCGGSDGSITITGLTSGNNYTVNYTGFAGTPANGATAMATGGRIVITGLLSGPYTNISVEDPNSCSSNLVPSVMLSDPTSPTVNDPSDQVLCKGASTTTVNFSGTPGASFSWINDTPSIGLAASGSGDISSFTAVNAGSNPVVATITVTPSLSGCTGTAETFTIAVNPLSTIGASGTDPTSCGGSEGSIAITGLTSGNTYTVNYTGSAGTPANGGTAMASGGQIVITGLIAGIYTNISVVDANTCSSNVVANVSLSNPPTPFITSETSVDQQLCGMNDGQIIIVAGGATNIEYSINDGLSWQNSGIFNSLLPGMYMLKVRNADIPSCSISGSTLEIKEANDCTYEQDFNGSDPCACNNDQSDNGAEDGTFSELVSIEGPAFNNICVGPGSSGLIGVNVGTTIPETQSGIYQLSFDHIDGVGYVIEVVDCNTGSPVLNDAGNPLIITNICHYPVIQYSSPGDICSNSSSFNISTLVTIENTNDGYTDTNGSYDYTIDGNNTNTINPSSLSHGQHTLRIKYTPNQMQGTAVDLNAPVCPTELEVLINVNAVNCGSFPWGGN